MSELSLECSSCGSEVSFGKIEQVKEDGVLCHWCAGESANEGEVRREAKAMLRQHVAFTRSEDGDVYVMIGGKKIKDPSVVALLQRLRSLFWGSP